MRLWLVPLGILVGALVVALWPSAAEPETPQIAAMPKPLRPAVVRIYNDVGHGSGVHIGGGAILTAAHVVARPDVEYTVVDSKGYEQKAEILWASKEYDVALLKVPTSGLLNASALVCDDLPIGTPVRAEGYGLDKVMFTSLGQVGSDPIPYGDTKRVVPADISFAPGMSGGPVWTASGGLAGLVSSIKIIPMGYSATLTGIGLYVPASTICGLLGR